MKIPILKRIITKIRAKSVDTSGSTRQCIKKEKTEENLINHHPLKIKRPELPRIKNKVGYREDLGIVFKSKMEANVYRYYKHLQNKHGKISSIEYEPEISII